MAILPIHLTVTETWLDITASVALLDLIEEETVEIFHNGQGNIEVIIDTLGTTTIDSSYDKKGRYINGSQFLQFPYTPTTKFWVRRVKSTLKEESQIHLRKPVDNINIGGVDTPRDALRVILGYGDLFTAALGGAKTIQDVSLFSSSFIVNISRKKWIPFEDGVEIFKDIDLTRISHANGSAIITSGATIGNNSYLMSKRHPRHQSQRGHNASSLIIIPNRNATGIREFGLRSNYYGAFFRLRDGILYAVVRNSIGGVLQPDVEQLIGDIPFPFDMELGAAYNIQLQCPTARNAKFMILNSETGVSEIVHQMTFPGGIPFFINNSSMPFGYYAENTDGTDVEIQTRCADISTEGGTKGNRAFASVSSGAVATSTAELPMIALRIPNTVGGEMNTRDVMLSKLYASTDSSPIAEIRVYAFRDPTAITATSWTPTSEGLQEIAINGIITAFDATKMAKIFDVDIAANFLNVIENTGEEVDFILTHGDYLLITLQAKNNSQSKVTIAYSEEI